MLFQPLFSALPKDQEVLVRRSSWPLDLLERCGRPPPTHTYASIFLLIRCCCSSAPQGLFLVVCIFLLHRLQWLLRHMVGFPHKGDLRLLFARRLTRFRLRTPLSPDPPKDSGRRVRR